MYNITVIKKYSHPQKKKKNLMTINIEYSMRIILFKKFQIHNHFY